MAGFGLINMNGRLYDPYLQRFLSPDIVVQDPSNLQNYNRYSYCLNNPLRYVDPTGYVSDSYDLGEVVVEAVNLQLINQINSIIAGLTANMIAESYAQTMMQQGYFTRTINNRVLVYSDAAMTNNMASLNSGFINEVVVTGHKKEKLDESEKEAIGQEDSGWLDKFQTGLDVAGIADPTGFTDLANALIYLGRGQWGNAGISALAIIPYIGDFGKAGRLGTKTLQLTSRARTAEKGLELAEKFLKPGYTEIAPGVFRSSDQLRQFRMTTSDITGAHGPGPHFNFEIFNQLNLNKAVTNYHVSIINP